MTELIELLKKERADWCIRRDDLEAKCDKNDYEFDNYSQGYLNGVVEGLNLAITIARGCRCQNTK